MLKRGASVTVWNRTAARASALEAFGATAAESAGDAVAGAERVHMTLPDDAVVDGIVEQIAPRLSAGAIVVDHSTTSPGGAKARLERAEKAGRKFLPAPLFMWPQLVRHAGGIMLVSGPPAGFSPAGDPLAEMTG